jgi:hypothetical protein
MNDDINKILPRDKEDRGTDTTPWNGQDLSAACSPILAKDEAGRREALLSDLQNALAACGLKSVIVRRHRLVLEGASTKAATSGQTDPQLHVFIPGGRSVVTASGQGYLLGGCAFPASDAASAADALRRAADREVR